MLVHTFFDVMGSYGTMILSPFFDTRFSLDWVFIVDFFLVFTFLFPLIALRFWKNKDRLMARISVLLAGSYIALCAYNHAWSLSLAKDYASQRGLVIEDVAALPQPLSPFQWGNYILTKKRIYQGFVKLVEADEKDPAEGGNFLARFLARYQPISGLQYRELDRFDNSPWVDRALMLEGVKTFYWFARFPVARDNGVVNGNHRVEFFDLRFGIINGIKPPFVYVVGFDRKGKVAFQGFE